MHEVLGIGAPVVDYIVEVGEEFLAKLSGGKAGMVVVDYQTFSEILTETRETPILLLGGSSANTIRGLAHFGHSCAFLGRIGNDEAGQKFVEGFEALSINTTFLLRSDTPTSQVLCLVSPDKERTMRAFLGASRELKPEDLSTAMFEGVSLVHFEGYNLLNKPLTYRAMELAREVGVQISLDLGSHEIVESHKETIIDLLTNYVDIVFANRMELFSLTKLNPDKGSKELREICETVVVLLDKEGCLVGRGSEQFHVPAFPVKTPVDTTGAGDIFASGFLHGHLRGRSLEECARFGVLSGASIIQVHGVEMHKDEWKALQERMKDKG